MQTDEKTKKTPLVRGPSDNYYAEIRQFVTPSDTTEQSMPSSGSVGSNLGANGNSANESTKSSPTPLAAASAPRSPVAGSFGY